MLCNTREKIVSQGNVTRAFEKEVECPRYVALRNNLFTSVAQHTDCSLQTLLFGDLELNHRQNCDIFDAVQHFITLSKRFD